MRATNVSIHAITGLISSSLGWAFFLGGMECLRSISMAFSIVSFWLIRIPSAWYLSGTRLGIRGVWFAVGLSFADSAMLSAGPNTVLVLDQFAFDPYTRKGSFDVSLKRGTLSAIAGKLVSETPGSMRVRTPSAVLGVRGTEFVAQVGDVAK